MLSIRILLALALATAAVTLAPPAAAEGPCVMGASESDCAVAVKWVVCVTDPCNYNHVCVGFGAVCYRF
jgi:hypothetical protein